MDLGPTVRFVILVSGVVLFTESFNIDVKNAVVHRGKNGTAFGYRAEFIQQPSGDSWLLVTAPKESPVSSTESGLYFLCVPTDPRSCVRSSTAPENTSFTVSTDPGIGRFSEDNELFGLAMTVADKNTAVICGPLWSDLRYWSSDYIFNIGRCRILPATPNIHPGVQPYFHTRPQNYYIGEVEVNGFRTKAMLNGMAEFGFSAAGNGAGKVVIGAPGYSIARGGVVVLDTKTADFARMDLILDQEPDIDLGYAVSVGNFCNPDRLCFAVSNRQIIGKVYLMEYRSDTKSFSVLWSQQGEQAYSSFGTVLCAMDVNGDGWSDLLIGSPTYTVEINETVLYDAGRVFVYISHGTVISGQDNFELAGTLQGDEVAFARFGSAIGNIGDINRDSFHDLAVGAPLEENGAGALYIYLGGPNGPDKKHSQKIRGQDFQPSLLSFGTHISLPTVDWSSYSYPDFAVGAPESASVVFLKTRLIVNAQVKIKATPNPLDPSNAVCPDIQPTSQRGNGCLNVSLCLNFTYSTSGFKTRDISFNFLDFDITLEIDKLITNDASRRARLYLATDGQTSTLLKTTVKISSTNPLCQSFIAILQQDQIDRNPFVPLQLQASFNLNTTSFPSIAPILNQSMPSSYTEEVKFRNRCGEDEVCKTDLMLSGHLLYIPTAELAALNVVNYTNHAELLLNLANGGEIAFGVHLNTTISGHINFRTATGNTSVVCESVVDKLLVCRSWTPLRQHEAVQIRLQFLADSVPLDKQNRRIEFEVKVTPSDHVQNPEVDPANNRKTFTLETAIVADLKMNGWSDPREVHVQASDQADLTVTHKLLLDNLGPSFLPATHINVSLPYKDRTGADIISEANVTIKLGDRTTVECPQLQSTGSVFDTTTSVIATSTRLPSGTGSPSAGKTTDDPFGGGIDPMRRRRRRRQTEELPSEGVDAKSRQQQIDCSKFHCLVYQCSLSDLQPRLKAEVNVAVSVKRSAISFPENVDTLYYTSTTAAAQPDHPLFYPWEDPAKIRQVQTAIKRVSTSDVINIWIIIGGVIAGLVLLIIIAVVAWRLGFFRRKDKAKLERLKRQSGFYESKRSQRRSSQRVPDDAAGPAEADPQ